MKLSRRNVGKLWKCNGRSTISGKMVRSKQKRKRNRPLPEFEGLLEEETRNLNE